MAGSANRTPEERALRRVQEFTGLMWRLNSKSDESPRLRFEASSTEPEAPTAMGLS